MSSGSPTVPGESVADGIGRVAGFVNSYVFRDAEQTYLIDTGFSRRARPIVRAFRVADVPLARVNRILLTHHHLDHRGGAAFLLETSQAPVACHTDDVVYVTGRTKTELPLLLRWFVRVRPAPVATPLHEGDRVGPLVVVHVPGHTPGEVAFYHPERKILFSGDSVVEREGHLTLPGAKVAANLEQAVRSLSRLRELEVELLLPGHGVPVRKDVRSQLDELIRRAPAQFLSRPPS